MSFKEKSIWVSLVTTVFIFSYYFISLQSLADLPVNETKQIAGELLLKAIIMMIIVEIIFHIIIAIFNPDDAQQKADERDKLYQLKANSIGYSFLILGVMISLGHILLNEFLAPTDTSEVIQVFPLLTAHILLFSFIISELARFTSQLFFYRKGA
ncbi:hypothetical protein [Paraglaciecola sp. L1A13]|uniref:hypothetical protein n=1 Tax=Paraglaciecola sp. L1A13 TaxID=2686359 RepID=UPI00131BEFA4|nr:hypothetical protein [Paraglaciecola sp. L1A13]